jgi:hypothetical protein
MSKSRMTIIVTFLIVGCVLIFISFFAKLEHWSNLVYCAFAFGGFLLATSALVLTIRSAKAK